MKLNELSHWKTTLAVVSVVIVVILVGFLTISKPLMTYKLDMSQSIHELNNKEALFTPEQLGSYLEKKMSNVVLFDIRDNFVYGQGHIPGAENMSAHELSKVKNIERLSDLKKKGVTVVLYGEDQLAANGPWMLFRQAGFDNVKVLLGGYKYYFENKDNFTNATQNNPYLKELPRYDYAEVASPGSSPDTEKSSAEKKEVNVVKRGKTSAAKGGC